MSSESEISESGSEVVFKPAILPCGRIVQNRLVKVALYEHLAPLFGGSPNPFHIRLYSEWAKHDWGIVLTGNVQVAPDHLSLGRDIVLPHDLINPKDEELLLFRQLANVMHGGPLRPGSQKNKTLAIMQLSHAGRQSCNFIGGRRVFHRPLAPSPIQVGSGLSRKATLIEQLLNNVLFQTPKEMTEEDILNVVVRFVYGAVFAQKAGFDGIQLHAAHGYLLAQFLSPKTNKRTDAYSYDKAINLIHTIVSKIRSLTSPDFVIGIKLNVADYTNSATGPNISLTDHEQRAMQHLFSIASWAIVDFIEISGGDYETPTFLSPSAPTNQKSTRQAFFTRFSHQAIQALLTASNVSKRPLILLTGGLRTAALLTTALALNHADLVGIGRAAIRSPDIPIILKSKVGCLAREHMSSAPDNWDAPFSPDPELKTPPYPPINWIWNLLTSVKLVGAGADVAWHTLAMRAIASLPMTGDDGQPIAPPKLEYELSAVYCSLRMFFWRIPNDINRIQQAR